MATDIVVTKTVSLRTRKRSYMLRVVQDGETTNTIQLDEEAFDDLTGHQPPAQLVHDSPSNRPVSSERPQENDARPVQGARGGALVGMAVSPEGSTLRKRLRTLGEMTGLGSMKEASDGSTGEGSIVEGDVTIAEPSDY